MTDIAVNEIFETIQGEATFTGTPAIFVRLQGCPVGCPWCLDPDARFLTGDFQTVAAGDVRAGMSMIGTRRNDQFWRAVGPYDRGVVLDVVRRKAAARKRVIFQDGRETTVSFGHRFVLHGDNGAGGRFRRVEMLKPGQSIRSYDPGPGQAMTLSFRQGYVAGAADGDGSFHDKAMTSSGFRPRHFVLATKDHCILERVRAFAADFGFSLHWGLHTSGGQFAPPERIGCLRLTVTDRVTALETFVAEEPDSQDWRIGYLSGMYDTDGHTDGAVMRFTQIKPRTRERLRRIAARAGAPVVEEIKGLRVVGGATVVRPLLAQMRPAVERKIDPLWFQEHRHSGTALVDTVEDVGVGEIVSIMTSLGTYVADGLPAKNCDTKHTWDLEGAPAISTEAMLAKHKDAPTHAVMKSAEIIDLLTSSRFRARHVVITGGEPCLYDLGPLTYAISRAGMTAQVETSGTQPVAVSQKTWVTVSPKIDMPGGFDVLRQAIQAASEIKMPIGKMADIEALEQVLTMRDRPCPVWLQPLSMSDKATRLCAEQAIAHARDGWRVSIQVHKIMGVR
jgi:7-carboxy-7-deazaguanine synthase